MQSGSVDYGIGCALATGGWRVKVPVLRTHGTPWSVAAAGMENQRFHAPYDATSNRHPMPAAPIAIPLSDEQMLKLAAQQLFDVFASTAMGMMVVDRQHRIVWISEGYKQFLPALGFERAEQFVGKRVEEVVPNTLMAAGHRQRQADIGRPAEQQGDSRKRP